jgi:hypothetical protein
MLHHIPPSTPQALVNIALVNIALVNIALVNIALVNIVLFLIVQSLRPSKRLFINTLRFL